MIDEDQRKIEKILNIAGTYIQNSGEFDIIKSEKLGYVFLEFYGNEIVLTPEVIINAQQLYDLLLLYMNSDKKADEDLIVRMQEVLEEDI